MIDVMFFLPSLGGGGAEMNAVRLARPLLANGFRPTYCVTSGAGTYRDRLPEGVEVVVLDTGGAKSSTLRLLRAIPSLRKEIEARRPGILIPVMALPAVAGLMASEKAKHKPIVIASIQNGLMVSHVERANLRRRIELWLMRRLFPKADGFIALTHGVGADLRELMPEIRDRIAVVHNIGKPENLPPASQEAGERPYPATAPYEVLACGRLVEQKDYPTLLAAFAAIAHECDAHLRILGEGPLRDDLMHQVRRLGIAERVEFLGFRRDAQDYMGRADLFVLSSIYEGFGNVIVEAMAMGAPVVSTACPHGPEEIITDGVDGVLVPVGQPRTLADAMSALLADSVRRARIAQAGRVRADDFGQDRIGQQFAQALKALSSRT